MEVQIFGTRKSPDVRKALRFFSERGWKIHLVDLTVRPISPGELRRFVERFGVDALVDRESRRFRDLGLSAAPSGEARWIERLLSEPLLLRQPLVRSGSRISVGLAEEQWRTWTAG